MPRRWDQRLSRRGNPTAATDHDSTTSLAQGFAPSTAWWSTTSSTCRSARRSFMGNTNGSRRGLVAVELERVTTCRPACPASAPRDLVGSATACANVVRLRQVSGRRRIGSQVVQHRLRHVPKEDRRRRRVERTAARWALGNRSASIGSRPRRPQLELAVSKQTRGRRVNLTARRGLQPVQRVRSDAKHHGEHNETANFGQ